MSQSQVSLRWDARQNERTVISASTTVTTIVVALAGTSTSEGSTEIASRNATSAASQTSRGRLMRVSHQLSRPSPTITTASTTRMAGVGRAINGSWMRSTSVFSRNPVVPRGRRPPT